MLRLGARPSVPTLFPATFTKRYFKKKRKMSPTCSLCGWTDVLQTCALLLAAVGRRLPAAVRAAEAAVADLLRPAAPLRGGRRPSRVHGTLRSLFSFSLALPPAVGLTPIARLSSISHFAVGRSDVRGLRLTTFVYCRPAPYLPQVNTGLYKCMRWNVDLESSRPAAGEAWDGRSQELDMENLSVTN